MNILKLILLSIGLVYGSIAFGTNHDLYEMQYWSVENYCLRPVTVTLILVISQNGIHFAFSK
jgi:hypothetical protein